MNTTATVLPSDGLGSREYQDAQAVPVDRQFDSRPFWVQVEGTTEGIYVEGDTGIVTGSAPRADCELYVDRASRRPYARWTGAFECRPAGAGDPGSAFRVRATVSWGPVPPSWIAGTPEPEGMPIEIDLVRLGLDSYRAGWNGPLSTYEATRAVRTRPVGDGLRDAADAVIRERREVGL